MKPFNQKLPMSAALICMLLFTALSAQNLSSSDLLEKNGSSISTATKKYINLNDSIFTEIVTEKDDNKKINNFKAPSSKAMYDLQFAVDFTSTGIVSYAGAECDGVNLYASVWNSGDISVFTVTGTFVETFSIPGVIGTRDMAFDGTYFYGGAASSTMYQMDFDSQTVVSSISTGASGIRALAYDGEDGFFYANNWADDITLFDISGAVMNIIPYPETTGGSSTYGMAYDNVSDGGPFLWLTQSDANGDVWLSRMNLASGTLTDEILDIATTVGGAANASYGGLWIEHTEAFPTTYTIGGMLQGEIYMAYGYELTSESIVLENDVQVSGFTSPSSGMALGVEEVIVVIKNKGTAAQTTIPFEVTVEGAVFYTGTTTLTLAMGETEEVYCGTIDMSQGGNWNFEGCTSLAGDENPDNDCITMTIWSPLVCDPITDLAATVSNGEITLTWTAPGGGSGEWVGYDDGINGNNIGGPDIFYVAARWDAADIAMYDGYAITKMAIHPYMSGSSGTAQFNLMVWSGANAANVIMTEGLISYTPGEWNEYDLANPPTIDGSLELWVGYYVAVGGESLPAGTDAGPAIAGFGDMVSLDGVTWESMSIIYDQDYNWNIQAYVEYGKSGSTAILGKTKKIVSTGVLAAQEANVKGALFAPKDGIDFYEIYRNSASIGTTNSKFYNDAPGEGTYEYCVEAVYTSGCIADQVCATVGVIGDLEAPTDLEIAENWNAAGTDLNAILTWSHSECNGGASSWIGYGDGTNADGMGGPNTFYVAIRWDAADIAIYNGHAITKIAIHPYMSGSTGTAQINLMVWSGTNAANVMMDEALTSYTPGEWNEFNLANPPTIDGSQDLWIGYYIGNDDGSYPAGADAGPAIAGYGDMITLDGVTWESAFVAYSLNCNWNIQAYVDFGKTGSSVILGKTKEIASTTTPVAQGAIVSGATFVPKGFTTFVIYDANSNVEVGTTTNCGYIVAFDDISTDCYYIKARYGGGDSEPSNTTCLTSIGDLDATILNIYPNPASAFLFIESAAQIERVTVYNMVGQLVLDREVSETDAVTLNTSTYETGVYLVKVQVAGEITVKRITVVN